MRERGNGSSCRGSPPVTGAPPPRRRFLQAAVAAGVSLGLAGVGKADEDKPGADERPKPGDLFVQAEGEHIGKTVEPGEIRLDAEPLQVWPMDPVSKVVRDGSRLNQVLLLRLDPGTLDEDTRAHSADGIVAFSAICQHAGCPVTGWVVGESGKHVLKCFCHNSEYDPRQNAAAVFGPAPRKLAALPVKIAGGALVVAHEFIGKVVPPQQG
jgi:rieske iron-sulfur protein